MTPTEEALYHAAWRAGFLAGREDAELGADLQRDVDGDLAQRIAGHLRSSAPRVEEYATVEQAACRMQLNANALRHRISRKARRDGKVISAHLGGGIMAYKVGRNWRIKFP